MTPREALAYGLIDEVIQHKRMIPDSKIPSLKVPPPLSIYDLGNISKPPPAIQDLSNDKKTWS